MKAGRMDRVIVIQRATAAINEYGTEAETWADVATIRAELIQSTTVEFIRESGASSDLAMVFRTRFLAGVKLSDRVSYDGRLHNILEIKEIGRRKGLELRTVARAQP